MISKTSAPVQLRFRRRPKSQLQTSTGFPTTTTTDPWTVVFDQANEKLLLDSDIQHDGPNSGLITWAHLAINYIRQPLASMPEADVPYTMSAWVRASDGGGGSPACRTAYIICAYGSGTSSVNVRRGSISISIPDQWLQISDTCTYTQNAITSGDLSIMVGFICNQGAQSWVDTVSFEA
ncbi:hypothetical protein FDECE_759 [Fusarium decemcellulare]|nr:hypothetical protein FDECE_759 [Fusarium decemcellulare]